MLRLDHIIGPTVNMMGVSASKGAWRPAIPCTVIGASSACHLIDRLPRQVASGAQGGALENSE